MSYVSGDANSTLISGPSKMGLPKRLAFLMLNTWLLIACSSSAPVANSVLGANEFEVSSPVMNDGGTLPSIFTCDGDSISPPLAWSGAPSGTASFAVLMDHQPGPNDWKWYWQLWDIEASVTSLPQNAEDIGVMGGNELSSVPSYEPPCSKGPGAKAYNFHVYALSESPVFSVAPGLVTRDIFLQTVEPLILAQSTMSVTYSRS